MKTIKLRNKGHSLKVIGLIYEDAAEVYEMVLEECGISAVVQMDDDGNFLMRRVPVELSGDTSTDPVVDTVEEDPAAPKGATWKDGVFSCDACGLTRKTEKGIENHLKKCEG